MTLNPKHLMQSVTARGGGGGGGGRAVPKAYSQGIKLRLPRPKELKLHCHNLGYSLKSVKRTYIGGYIGDYYGG